MLGALRSNTKIVLWIVVVGFVGFIFAGWGKGLQSSRRAGPERGTIGRVDGVPITYRDFTEMMRERLVTYAERMGGQVPDQTREVIQEEVWNALVSDILVEREIVRLGIDVPDRTVVDMLWSSPPDFVYNSAAFQDEQGNFNFDVYHREIQLNPERWEGIAQAYRTSLQRQMLQQEIQSAAFVSENEVWEEYVATNEKVRAKYVAVDPRRTESDGLEPTDEEVRNYFEMHRADYEKPATAVLDYIELVKEASPEDEEDIIVRLGELADAVREGEDFAELAKVYSEGPSAPDGGDLGWFDRARMVPEFTEAAFALDVGEVSEPVKTPFGYHLIKIEERRGRGDDEEIHARHILVEINPSEETLVGLEEELSELGRQALDEGLAATAAEAGLEVKTTTHFHDGREIPGVGTMRPAVKLTFESDPGTVLGPYVTPSAYYVFEVAERLSSSFPTFDEIVEEMAETGRDHPAKTALVAERTKDRARATADEIAQSVRSGATLEDAAAEHELEVRDTNPFSRRDYVSGVGKSNRFVGTSFGLRTGQTSGVIEVEQPNRFYVLRVEERTAADQEGFAEEKEQIRVRLMQSERIAIFSTWLQGLTAKADVEDFRDSYF